MAFIGQAQISFSWDLHYACNYRCSYCWWHGKWHDLAAMNRHMRVDELMRYWQNVYNKYGSVHIEILGGEPFIYQDFDELISRLSSLHSIGITTNLSCNVDKFVQGVYASKVNIRPTFHPSFSNFETFIKKCLQLKERGFTDGVNYLAYPPQISTIPYYKKKFNDFGFLFVVMTFWGEYENKRYPESYTEQEQEIIGISLGKRDGESFQIKPKQMPKGKLCFAGHTYAVIQADGTVVRCGGSGLNEKIGSFFDDGFSLLDAPQPCRAEYCKCNEWALLLTDKDSPPEDNTSPAIKVQESQFDFPPHCVFFTWDIHHACNYNCIYCPFSGKWEELAKKNVYPGKEKLIKIWRRIYEKYGSCHIQFSGGEPVIYPDFFDIIMVLRRYHSIECNTNLSFSPEVLFERIPPNNFKLTVSFHPGETEAEIFIKKCLQLRDAGYELRTVNYVAYPIFLERVARDKDKFADNGLNLNIMLFKGPYDNREYPEGYTDGERRILEECGYKFPLRPEDHPEPQKKLNDIVCRMGQTYAKIYPNGAVYRCCVENPEGYIGNLFDDNLELYNEPKICQNQKCPCDRAMIVGREQEWDNRWPIAKSG